jgi:hypothetical protein
LNSRLLIAAPGATVTTREMVEARGRSIPASTQMSARLALALAEGSRFPEALGGASVAAYTTAALEGKTRPVPRFSFQPFVLYFSRDLELIHCGRYVM